MTYDLLSDSISKITNTEEKKDPKINIRFLISEYYSFFMESFFHSPPAQAPWQ